MNRIDLPKNKTALVKAIDNAVASIEIERNPCAVEWLITNYWMRGIRRFKGLNYPEGSIGQIAHEGPDGRLMFKYEIALEKAQVEMGRLNQLDLRPSSLRKQRALESARKAGMGHVTLNYVLPEDRLEKIFFDLKIDLLQYGLVGLAPHITEWQDGTPIFDIEVIPPWELGCMPSRSASQGSEAAIVRDRWVPVDWLREQGWKIPKDAESVKKMGGVPVPWGNTVRNYQGPSGSSGGTAEAQLRAGMRGAGKSDSKPGDDSSTHVRLVEVFVRGPEDTLSRYIAKVGEIVLKDESYGDAAWKAKNPDVPLPPPFPIGTCGYYHNGTFYSRSFLAPLISLNKEIEELLKSLFKNVAEMDNMGALLIPTSMNINERKMKVTSKPKIIRYTRDAYSPDEPPGHIAPVNSGPLPGQIAQMALGLLDRQAAQSPMLSGQSPSRPSGPALSMLWQASHVPLDTVARSMSSAFVRVYRAILYEAKRRFSAIDTLEISNIDENLAGIVIDTETKKVKLGQNSLPWPHEVKISVRSIEPKDKEQELAKLLGLRQANIQISDARIAYCVAKGELPMPAGVFDREINSYEKALLSCLLLFSDGESPGEGLPFDRDSDSADMWIFTMDAFMSNAVFSLASDTVRQTFVNEKEKVMVAAQMKIPENAPGLEQAVMEQQQMAAMQQQMMAQAQAAPPQGQ